MKSSWNAPRFGALAQTLPTADQGETPWNAWLAGAMVVFRENCPKHLEALSEAGNLPAPTPMISVSHGGMSEADYKAQEESQQAEIAKHYLSWIAKLRPRVMSLLESVDGAAPTTATPTGVSRVLHILDRFRWVARQLRDRHDSRPTLEVKDEYDVQDLLHALLRVEFDDVRPEDPAPSQGGSSSRLDSLLYGEGIVVEVKKTRKSLGNKQLTTQQDDDIGRYQRHPDCKILFCFVYDPNELVKNPRGFETDHSRTEGALRVLTVVRPE